MKVKEPLLSTFYILQYISCIQRPPKGSNKSGLLSRWSVSTGSIRPIFKKGVDTEQWSLNSLPNNKKLDITKLKAFSGNKLHIAKMTISVFDRVKNTVGKGENAGYQHSVFQPGCTLAGFPQINYVSRLFPNMARQIWRLKIILCPQKLICPYTTAPRCKIVWDETALRA